MNTIPYPNTVKQNLTKYKLVSARVNKVIERTRLTHAEANNKNNAYRQNMSDLRYELVGK